MKKRDFVKPSNKAVSNKKFYRFALKKQNFPYFLD
jgi:hypothetical protein